MKVQTDELRVSRHDFGEVTARIGVPDDVRDRMWDGLAASPAAVRGDLGVRSVAWYGGAAVSMLAMGLFLGTSWAQAGSGVGLVLTLTYLAAFVGLAEVLRSRGHRVPAGLLAGSAVVLVPLAVFAVQSSTGLFRDTTFGEYDDFLTYVSGQWVWMELLTLAVGAALWWRHRAAFLLAPCAVAGWFLTMDLAAALTGGDLDDFALAPLSAVVTALLIAAAVALDRAGLRPEAFWIHLSGLMSLVWTIGRVDVDTDGRMTLIGVAGAASVAAGVVLSRRLHLTFGALLSFVALSYLAFEVFGGSPAFALALAGLGVATVLGGIRLDRATA